MDFPSAQDVGRLGAALAGTVPSAAGMGNLIVPPRTMGTLSGQEERFMKGVFLWMLESFVATLPA